MASERKRGKIKTKDIIAAWVRSSGRCHWCRESLEPEQVVIDHYMPVALGGTDDGGNLVTSCRPCNFAKRDKHPRIWELRMHDGLPLCIATEIHRFEEGLPPQDGKGTFFVGAQYQTLSDGRRRVVKLPLAYGNCDSAHCADCNLELGDDRLFEKQQ